MFNKSKVLVLSLASMATLGLVGCGQSSSSFVEDPTISQNTSSVVVAKENLQLVGSVKSTVGETTTTIACWDPTGADDTSNPSHFKNPHFTFVSSSLYTLLNVSMDKDSEFKFTYDDKWSNDFGFGSIQFETAIAANFENADSTGKASGNIKVVTAGTYDCYYHPFYVAEPDVTAKMVIKAHVA